MSKTLDFYKQFINSEDRVFDIGANVGGRTEVFSRLARVVISVEPLLDIYRTLSSVFQYNENVVCLQRACGSGVEASPATIMLYDPTYPLGGISSMSKNWVDAVRKSNRFTEHGEACWTSTAEVEVTTLDKLIQHYGKPSFIKIDVEGYEPEVLAGLSESVPALSFEFTPERMVDAFSCINHCVVLGMKEFSISLKESFELTPWENAAVTKARLKEHLGDNVMYGDVYARCEL